MHEATLKVRKKKGVIKSSRLALIAFISAFFPRLIESVGAPAPINFLHFLIVPLASAIILLTSRSRIRKQVLIVQQMLALLVLFLAVILFSAILNGAGEINAILSFLLLGEPFILLIAIISVPMSLPSFSFFQGWMRKFFIFHIFLALFQRYVLRVDLLNTGMEPADNIQGVFFLSGAGHVVGASVSLTFGLYYLVKAKDVPLWLRISVAIAAFWQLLIADAKQVLLAFMVAGIILLLTKFKNIAQAIQYIGIGCIFGYAFYWCLQNVEAFDAFNVWIRPELYGPEGEATLLKTSVFRIVPQHYESILHWGFGLGPGHTVGRLGGWMLREYSDLLSPLGSTRHPASSAVWKAVGESWLGDQSSMFSPLFGWAGIWGDLGLIGLGVYLALAYLVWHYVCVDDISKFLLLTVFAFGLIFSQMEEPGYMLSIAAILGLHWQQNQIQPKLYRSKPDAIAIPDGV